MKRRVVQHGRSTLIVSLPSKWVKRNSISKGDEIEIDEQQNVLTISAEKKQQLLSATVDISGLDRTTIMYAIRGYYRMGYDELIINFNNPTTLYQRVQKKINVLSVIHTEVNRLIGYEIVQEREKSCIIKDLQEASFKDFDNILRRIFLLVCDASEDFVKALKMNDQYLMDTIQEKHDTITKFVSYCLRILNKKDYPEPRKTNYYYHIIAVLDRLTDIIKYGARDCRAYKKTVNEKVVTFIEEISNDIVLYHKLFYKFDRNIILQIDDNRYKLERQLRQFSDDIAPRELIIAANFFSIEELLLDLIEARSALETNSGM